MTKSPAGAHQWKPVNNGGAGTVPDAHNPAIRHNPVMTTADLAMRFDPEYEKISRRFFENPNELKDAFARAWYKLTHRDMGPIERYLGPEVPKEELIWQDPISKNAIQLNDIEIADLKSKISASGLSVSEMVATAWSSASTFRNSDKRGGANGARIALEPQKNWRANNPVQLAKVLEVLKAIQSSFNANGKQVSLADLIVLAGNVGIEKAAKNSGYPLNITFKSGRADATQSQTDAASFMVLEPKADGFINYKNTKHLASAEEMLVDKAQLMTLTVPEMTVLVGGMRMLNTNFDSSKNGVFTNKVETLSNDFFFNLLDININWQSVNNTQDVFEGRNRVTGELKWTGSRVDLIFGSNSELRAIAEVYGCLDSQEQFVNDFAKAWTKVMNLGRY